MSRSRIKFGACALLTATALAGCSETYLAQHNSLYLDRRESISPSAGDAFYANQVAHMVDPWPPHSANRNISHDGQRIQSAAERYRTNKVTPPANSTTSSAGYQAPSVPVTQAAK